VNEVCVYKANPDVYSRAFSRAGEAWSAACGAPYGPYWTTSRPVNDNPCLNCKRPIRLDPGLYNYEKDFEKPEKEETTGS
jgi:hypothetical protein